MGKNLHRICCFLLFIFIKLFIRARLNHRTNGKVPFRKVNRLSLENKLLLLFPHAWHVDLAIHAQWRLGLKRICVAKDNTGQEISLSKRHAIPPQSNTTYPAIYFAIHELYERAKTVAICL